MVHSSDLSTVALLKDEDDMCTLRVHKAGEKPLEEDDDDEEIDPDAPGEASGLVDVEGRVLLQVHTRREWRQMFYESWAAAVRHIHPCVRDAIDASAVLSVYDSHERHPYYG